MASSNEDELYTLIHNLRSPLGSIITSLSLSAESLNNSDDIELVQKTLDFALRAANIALNQIDRFVDLHKLENGQIILDVIPVPLADVMNDVVGQMLPQFQEAEIKVDVHLCPCFVSVDVNYFQQVMLCLLENALAYTPSGQHVRILSCSTEDPNRVMVQVMDSGPGIPVEQRKHVFEKFTRLSEPLPIRGNKGIGLGLAFSKFVIERQGGQIRVGENCSLPGACIEFTLPLASSPPNYFES